MPFFNKRYGDFMQEPFDFDALPDDIQKYVMNYFGLGSDSKSLMLVNKKFYRLANELFEKIFIEQFPHRYELLKSGINVNWYHQIQKAYQEEYQGEFWRDCVLIKEIQIPLKSGSGYKIEKDPEEQTALYRQQEHLFFIAKKGDLAAFQSLCIDGKVLNILQFCQDINGNTPLTWMRIKGHQACLDFIFSSCPIYKIYCPAFFKRNLAFAVCCNQTQAIDNTRKYLSSYESPPRAVATDAAKFEGTLCKMAIDHNHAPLLVEQLKKGIVPQKYPDKFEKVIANVIARRHLGILEILLTNGVSPNALTQCRWVQSIDIKRKRVGIMWACPYDRSGVVAEYVEQNPFEMPVIMDAITLNDVNVVKPLLKVGADVNCRDRNPMELMDTVESNGHSCKEVRPLIELAMLIKELTQISNETSLQGNHGASQLEFFKSAIVSAIQDVIRPDRAPMLAAASALFDVVIKDASSETLVPHKSMLCCSQLSQICQQLIPQIPGGDILFQDVVFSETATAEKENAQPAPQGNEKCSIQ